MTSVLYSAGLNYQVGNPVRYEINKLTAAIDELRKVVEQQGTEITTLKEKIAHLEGGSTPALSTADTLRSSNDPGRLGR